MCPKRIVVVLALAGLAAACGDDGTEPAVPTSLSITPNTVELIEGESEELSLTVRDQNGQPMTNVNVVWRVTPNTLASVSSSGTVTALTPGSGSIIAEAGDAQGVASLRVAEPFDVEFSTSVDFSDFDQGDNRWECHYTVTAESVGGLGAEHLTWEESEGEVRYEGGTSSGTFTIDVVRLADWFGSTQMNQGETQTADLFVWHSSREIRSVLYNFRYWLGDRGEGPLQSKTVFVDC